MIGGDIFERVVANLQAQVDELEVENGALEAQMAIGRDDQENGQIHKGFGKLILFGEHFVVYKVPALVGAVAAYTDCQVRMTTEPGVVTIDNRPATPGYKVKKQAEHDEATALVLKHLGVDTTKKGSGIEITLGGELCCVSGIGASASFCVSLARAVNHTLQMNMTEEQINATGYEGEKGYHGTPSGIDNTAACYGGVLKFQRTAGDPKFELKAIKQPVQIVYASTGITASTTEVVGDVRDKKEADPEWWDALLAKYVALVEAAEPVLEAGDAVALGKLVDANHVLCQELTVSCPELDKLVLAARAAGAVGAKMSGTGRGGLMLAITPGDALQASVAEALKKNGAAQVWTTTLA